MKKYLIFPNEVSAYNNLKRGTRVRRFWGSIEQAGSGQELKLSFMPPFSNRIINDAIQAKLLKLFEKEGFTLKRIQSHTNKELKAILYDAGVDILVTKKKEVETKKALN